MMLRRWILLSMIVAASAAPTVRAVTTDPQPVSSRNTVLHQALADYEAAVAMRNASSPEARERFERAADGFNRLLDSGVINAGLYFNLANTQVRLGLVGPAIVNYRRALRLDPGNDRIQRNLQFARKLCRTPIPTRALSQFADTVFAWHYRTAFTGRLRLGLASYAVFWILLGGGRFLLRRPPALRWTTRVVGALAVVLLASVAWDRYRRTHVEDGVLTAPEVVLRKGYGENYDPQLDKPLAEGVEVRILHKRQDVDGRQWFFIELPDGKNGYLRQDQCTVI